MSARTISLAIVILFLAGAAYLEFVPHKKALPLPPPPVPAVSFCTEPTQGMRRIGERTGLQFDVPVKDLAIHEGFSDTPPWEHSFSLGTKDGPYLSISWHAAETVANWLPIPPALTDSPDSTLVEKRKIFDDNLNMIGEDSWGYLKSGNRWRRVHFRGSIVASYGDENEKDVASYDSGHEHDAFLLDRVINSACFAP